MNEETIRQWAVGVLQKKQGRGEGAANLNREIINRLESLNVYSEGGEPVDVAVPEELIAVIARQLRVDGRVRNEPRSRSKIAQMAAALALALDPMLSDKKLARSCGTNREKVARWRKDPQFNRAVLVFRASEVLKEITSAGGARAGAKEKRP